MKALRCLVQLIPWIGLASCNPSEIDLLSSGLGENSSPIIAGAVAPQPVFDHTGALVRIDLEGNVSAFCTATLIAPEVIVTAKHCAKSFPDIEKLGSIIEWRTGPTVVAPTHRARIVAVRTAPGGVGGYVGEGRDVAVALLADPVEVEPVVLGSLGEEHLGQSLLTLGYGVFSPSGLADGQRRLGRETPHTLSGKVNEALFGDFESFAEWSFSRSVTDDDFLALHPEEEVIEQWRIEYDSSWLLDEHEAVGGAGPSDLISCRGDSGGPLLRVLPDGRWESLGVISGGPGSNRSECSFGTVYATFGPVTMPFLHDATDWVDPCGELDFAGRCEGDSVERCVSIIGADIHRIEVKDCAELGQQCVETSVGASCEAAGDSETN